MIANYYNLAEVYAYRYKDFEIKEAKDKAEHYLIKLKESFGSRSFDSATLNNNHNIPLFVDQLNNLIGTGNKNETNSK